VYQTTGLFEIPELVPVLVGSVWELESYVLDMEQKLVDLQGTRETSFHGM